MLSSRHTGVVNLNLCQSFFLFSSDRIVCGTNFPASDALPDEFIKFPSNFLDFISAAVMERKPTRVEAIAARESFASPQKHNLKAITLALKIR